jgi:hypothetical protein
MHPLASVRANIDGLAKRKAALPRLPELTQNRTLGELANTSAVARAQASLTSKKPMALAKLVKGK